MRVLVACEYSATVRDAFRARGHDAWSVDIVATEGDPRWHIVGDAVQVGRAQHWDLVIAFPPCTHLSSSGARWWPDKQADGRQAWAVFFVMQLWSLPAARVVIENPVGKLSTDFRKPDQIIQPWQHGHGEVKTTCLWVRGVPLLRPSDVVAGREQRMWRMGETADRARERSRTYPGVAAAMSDQWGRAS
jgi:site-specific DNA-cytosine methylase